MRKAALLLLIAPLVLAACGGGSSSAQVQADPLAYVKHSAQKTAQISSEHMAMTMTVSAAGESFSMKGNGDYVNKPLQSTMDMSMSVMGHDVTFKGVQDGTTLYISSPLFSTKLPAGKTWMKIDMAKLHNSKGIDYSSLMSRSPSQALQQVEAAGSVKSIGVETVDGIEATHYQVTNLDLSKLPQGANLQGLGASMSNATIDVWIGNKDGYVYRETGSFAVSVQGQSAKVTMQIDFSNFGEKVSVTIPPASQAFDASNLANGGLGG